MPPALRFCWLALTLVFFGYQCAAAPRQDKSIKVVDPLKVSPEGDPAGAVITVLPSSSTVRQNCDVVVIGGGLGGCAAALAAARNGMHVCMTEPTQWIGGQMTSQGVSALDENDLTAVTGATRSYLELRRGIANAYGRLLGVSSVPVHFNPGQCWVSAECFQPRVALEQLTRLLQPWVARKRIQIFLRSVPVRVQRNGRQIESVLVYDLSRRQCRLLRGPIFIDASELGDLLALAAVPFVIGAESRAQTAEPDAGERPDPAAAQSFTYTFDLGSYGTASPLPQPPGYSRWKQQFSLRVNYGSGRILTYGFYTNRAGTPGSFWAYRRIVDAAQFPPGVFGGDEALINWTSNDYCDPGLLSGDALEQAAALQRAKQVSLGFAYWLQHEAERDDGGRGHPELRLLLSAMGSGDGLSQFPYIRESRRIVALRSIREQDISSNYQHGVRAALFDDSVGIGQYPIDIHSCTHRDFTSQSRPFQIPLRSLIPAGIDNLLAGSKDIGTTHITNGAYRVHPVEWAIGEAAGTAAAFAVAHNVSLAAIVRRPDLMRTLQLELLNDGVPIFWFDDLPLSSPWFVGAQYVSATNLSTPPADTLHFSPDETVDTQEAADAILRVMRLSPVLTSRFNQVVAELRNSSGAIEWRQLPLSGVEAQRDRGTVHRGPFAVWLTNLSRSAAASALPQK